MAQEKIRLPWEDWRIVKRLGGGSFGSVYEIERDLFGDKEKAALKIINVPPDRNEFRELSESGFDRESINNRFYSDLCDIANEYKLMAQLKGNANIIHCEDISHQQNEDGIGYRLYIRMELLHPIAEVISFPPAESVVIQLGTDLCNALSACRKHNIIHRDIKPANILVSSSGSFKLGDFGVSKTADRTAGGTRTGTFNYMAPEVYNNQPYNQLVDIYSLGMVLYWMLNRRTQPFLPLPPAMPTARQADEAMQRRFSGTPLPPPADGSDALKAVVLKACAFDPAARFATPEEFAAALRAVGKGQTPVSPQPAASVSAAPAQDSGTAVPPRSERTMGNSWGSDADATAGTSAGRRAFDSGATVGGESRAAADTGDSAPLRKGAFDLTAELTLTAEEVKNGCTKTVSFGERSVTFTIQPGEAVKDGTMMRFKGCGKTDPATGACGDGFLRLHISEQQGGIWGSQTALPYALITPAQASKGCVINVGGQQVTVPAGCKDGQTVGGVQVLIQNLDLSGEVDFDKMRCSDIRKLSMLNIEAFKPNTGTVMVTSLIIAVICLLLASVLPFMFFAFAVAISYMVRAPFQHSRKKKHYAYLQERQKLAKSLIERNDAYADGTAVTIVANQTCTVTEVIAYQGMRLGLGHTFCKYRVGEEEFSMRTNVSGTVQEISVKPGQTLQQDERVGVIRKEIFDK